MLMSRRRRLFITVTTIGAFIVGFIFAWNVFNPTPSAADPDPVRAESAPTHGEVASARDDPALAGDDLETGVGGSGTGGHRPTVAADDGAGNLGLGADCAELSDRFVGLHDGYVAIFAGTPDGCRELIETRPQPVSQLPPFQVADLRRGIVFYDDDELFQILEGLVVP